MFSLRPVGARARYIPIVSLVLGKAPQSSLTFSATRLYYDATRPIHGYPTMATDNEHKDGGSTTPSRRSRGGKGQQNKGKAKTKRPTHFICLPLVTESSIPQLSESLAHFRSVTTPLLDANTTGRNDAAGRNPEPEGSSATGLRSTNTSTRPEAGVGPGSNGGGTSIRRDETLRLVPAGAHRPPGTFHLTLGTMDLSEQEDMDMALRLLQDIDYVQLLGDAERQRDELLRDKPERRAKRGETPTATDPCEGQDPVEEQGEIEEEGENHDREDKVEADLEVESGTESGGQREGKGILQAAKEAIKAPLQSLARSISPPPLSGSTTLSTAQSASASTPAVSVSGPVSGQEQQHDCHLATSLTITLSGLGTFPSASSSRVFYANPQDPTSRLLPFGRLVRQRFQDAGLVTETRPLVLHATVANLIYDKTKKGKGKGRYGKGACGGGGMGVDARDILRFFNDGRAVRHREEALQMARRTEDTAKILARDEAAAGKAREAEEKEVDVEDEHLQQHKIEANDEGRGDSSSGSSDAMNKNEALSEYIWASDIRVDRIRICKMGAAKSDIEGWGLEYKAVAEKVFYP